MSRVKGGTTTRTRHKKILKLAKGYRGRSSKCYRPALQRVEKALQYAYRDRRNKKRDFRGLWIQRINAATREHGMTYSRFIDGLTKAGIVVDRKVMADLAVFEPAAFKDLVSAAQAGLKSSSPAPKQVPVVSKTMTQIRKELPQPGTKSPAAKPKVSAVKPNVAPAPKAAAAKASPSKVTEPKVAAEKKPAAPAKNIEAPKEQKAPSAPKKTTTKKDA